ncbi:MAG: PTS sugar transporter subunit IIA [Planctomycetota bacterium]|jgi:fructose-specific phosphotransferase system IIA component
MVTVAMNILDALSLQTIKVPLVATDKKGVIEELVDVLGAAGLIEDTDTLKELVWEREQQRTTGIGEGLAIPHGKGNCTDKLVIAVGRPSEPIDFKSVDKKPVQLVVLLASPPDKTSEHIQALGKISRLMADPVLREKAFHAETADALYELFQNAEA